MLPLEAELGILSIDIRLQDCSRMQCLTLLRDNDNALKDKLIASLRNPKPYPLPPQILIKQGTKTLPHLIGKTNIDTSKIRVETEPNTFCKNFINIKRVGLQLPQTDINSEVRKTLHINFLVASY